MSNTKQIRFGAILSYVSIALNVLAGLIYTPWMIRQIGESDYGLYTLANSLISLFLVDFGLSTATSRYVSKYLAEGREEEANNFLGVVYKLYLILDAVLFVVFLVLFFFVDKIYLNLTAEELEKFKIVYAIAASYALIHFPFVNLNGILTAYEKFIQQKFADILSRVLTVSLTVAALWCGMGLYALVAVHSVAGMIVIAYKLFAIRTSTSVRVHFRYRNKSLYRSIFSFSLWTTITTLAQRLIFNITPTILGIVANSTAIAVFGVVTTIEQYTYLITSAISGMFMPKVAKLYAAGDAQNTVLPLMIKVGRFQFAINGLIVAGFAVLGKSFLTLWVGEDFSEAYSGVLLVIVPGLFYNSLQIANTAMIVQNKVRLEAIITAVTGLVNLILSFVLSSRLGVLGACISIFIAYSLRAILFHAVHRRVMKFDIFLFIRKCYFKMLPPVVLTVVAGLLLNCLLPENGIALLCFKALFVSLFYLLSLFLLGLTRREQKNCLTKAKKLLSF